MRRPSSADWWPAVRARQLGTGSMRGVRGFALVAGFASMLTVVQAIHPFPSTLQASTVADEQPEPYDRPAVVGAASLHIQQPGYALWAEPDSADVTVTSPSGRIYTSLPLSAMIGRVDLPQGATVRTAMQRGGLHTVVRDSSRHLLVDAVLHPSAHWFEVTFSAAVGPAHDQLPTFFSTGDHGLAMSTITGGYTPDPRGPSSAPLPAVSTVGRTPFAPPPFDIQLRSAPGWFGIGLVQVPAATALGLQPDGGVSVDYTLARASSASDFGAGTATLPGMVRFPDFVVSFASDPVSGLRAYHDALVAQHAITVASPPGSRPQWWSDPIVDTWGQQMATGAQRGSTSYNSAWVRNFAHEWRSRYHVEHFTVVVDSRWQARIGDPTPDDVRFGGVTGMRTLVDQLHAEGLHVLLWWPMWAHRIDVIPMSAKQARLAQLGHVIDPTDPVFTSTMAQTVEAMLGTAPGDLAADGLKLDWQYDIPATLTRADQGGAEALYRYMDVIHTAAHALRHDAMIDASAAAPQFAAVADTVRLYDAWSSAEWDRRAAIVSAADPDVLIDGDGWQAGPNDLLPHTVSSTVYGTPAVYFSSVWMGGLAIPASESAEVGAVLALSDLKGQGYATQLGDGEWQYVVGHTVTARTFAGERALVARSPECTPTWRELAVSTLSGRMQVPLTGAKLLGVVDGAGRRVAATPTVHGVVVSMRAGTSYWLSFDGGC